MLITIAATIFVLGLLVLVHELGHFITAKLAGMRVDEFAIGFGPKLFSIKRGETVYSIRAVPLGGFNDIAGMNPEDNDAGERGYCERPVGHRMVVILAGVFMNFLLPIFRPLPSYRDADGKEHVYNWKEERFPCFPTSVEFLPSQAKTFNAN